MLDPRELGLDADALPMGPDPRALGQARLQNPSYLGLRRCHTHATWGRRPFPASIFLGMEGDALPKLIIIIIIIIITTIIIIDFTLKIKSMFYFL
jgi:hypothetical protein